MIKEKITPVIKDKFREAIRETAATGNEYAIFICKDEKGDLSTTDKMLGSETRIVMGPPVKCPFITQGNFHTHADVLNTKKYIFKDRQMSDEVARRIVLEIARREGFPVTTPSHPDLLNALLSKCTKGTEGTVCIGSDADPDRVDCWTATEESRQHCLQALLRLQSEFKPDLPKEWIRPLFDKEIVDIS